MKRNEMFYVLMALLGLAAADELSGVRFAFRKLGQLSPTEIRQQFGSQSANNRSPRPSSLPSPDGGSPDDWEILSRAAVRGAVNTVFSRIDKPREALALAFGDLVYSTRNIRGATQRTRLTLNSGQTITIELIRSGISRPGLFHLFRIASHSDGFLTSGSKQISIVGSQFFIQSSGVSRAFIEVGWLMEVDPEDEKGLVVRLFQGIADELTARFKAVFSGDDCFADFDIASLHRDISGVCNNVRNPFGIAGHKLFRIGEPDFGDGQSSLGGSTINPRLISNIVCREDSSEDDGENRMSATDLFVFMAQFIDHDLGISPVGSFARSVQPLFSVSFERFLDEIPIEIPEDDPDFEAGRELPFERAVFLRENNKEVLPREIVNEITSFLDLSQVYGSTASRARALRDFNGGKLKISGEDMLPFNGDVDGGIGLAIENAPDATSRFPVAGDIRVAENANLQALHTVFMREHNLIADEIASFFETDEEIYQTARTIAIAEYQSILYTEWLPIILGDDTPKPSDFNYDNRVDASADAFFTTASFRFGHSMISSKLWRVDPGETTPSTTLTLREVFFQPEAVTADTIDSWIRGMMWHEAREPDEKVVDDLRSFLFSQDGAPSQDLIALNILRARDMGVPTYNKARVAFGLPRKESIADITSNEETRAKLEEAYGGDVDAIDSFIGGLAEDKPEGRLFGELFHESIKEQFVRLRDGDRYFYSDQDFELLEDIYPRALRIQNDEVKLIEVLERVSKSITAEELSGRASAMQL